jgi:hypothetical protein
MIVDPNSDREPNTKLQRPQSCAFSRNKSATFHKTVCRRSAACKHFMANRPGMFVAAFPGLS